MRWGIALFTDKEHHTRITRLISANRTTTDPATAEIVLRFKQPFENHNGGWLDFGPDGMLYIGNGDGGSANDPQQNGQALDTWLGRYIFADYVNPRIWSFRLNNGKVADFKDQTEALQPADGRISQIASFAEDHDGGLFIIDHSGPVYRIIGR